MGVLLFFLLSFCFEFIEANHFVLISTPGSGKGTFSQYMVQMYDYMHICPGDIFRAEIRAKTPLGRQIQPVLERGDYVDEKIVCDLIEKKLDSVLALKKQFILDGFPRSIDSLVFLQEYLTKRNLLDKIVFLRFNTDDYTCKQRILTRKVCTGCSRVYNSITAKPDIAGTCNNCGLTLITREGDAPDIITKRLIYYHENIAPLFDRAKTLCTIHEINVSQSIEDLRKEYDQLVA